MRTRAESVVDEAKGAELRSGLPSAEGGELMVGRRRPVTILTCRGSFAADDDDEGKQRTSRAGSTRSARFAAS